MRRLCFYSGALVLVAFLLAGCGGGDDDDTTAPAAAPVETPSALSKEELLAQGDAICAEVNAAVGTLASTEAADGATQAADLYSGMVERLKDLGAPSDDAGYSEFLAAAETLAQAQSDVRLAAERGEEEALTTAEAEASSALSSFQSAADSYGFEQCGEAPSAPAPGVGGAPTEEAEVEPEPSEEVEEVEEAPEEVEEAPEPEVGGAGAEGGGAEAGGGTAGGGESSGGGSGGIGPG